MNTAGERVAGTDTVAGDDDRGGIDGRSLRRIRNREKVVDAYLELVAAGNRSPSVDDLARYSGISFRSIYRYFDEPTELVAAAAERGDELMLGDGSETEPETVGSLEERIADLVDQRLALFRRAMPFVAGRRPHTDDDAVELFARLRRMLIEQLGRQFAPELDGLDPDARQARQVAIYFGFLHDSLRMLHDLYPDDRSAIHSLLVDHVRRHLS